MAVEEAQERGKAVEVTAPMMQLKTQYRLEDLKIRETVPEGAERGIYRYSCPLCFRYMNRT